MTQEQETFEDGLEKLYMINEGNKLILKYQGFTRTERDIDIEQQHFHDDWQEQIPVWAKLWREGKTTAADQYEYTRAVFEEKSLAGFEILVSIIKRINHEQ